MGKISTIWTAAVVPNFIIIAAPIALKLFTAVDWPWRWVLFPLIVCLILALLQLLLAWYTGKGWTG